MAEPSGLNDRLTEKWAGLRLAHEAALLEDAVGVLANDRAAVRAHREQTVGGKPTEEPVIHVGDTHVHTATPTGAPSPAPPASKFWQLLPLLVALASGAGAGAIAPQLLSWLVQNARPAALQRSQQPAPQPIQQTQRVEDVELEVKWRLGPDGRWQAAVERVNP